MKTAYFLILLSIQFHAFAACVDSSTSFMLEGEAFGRSEVDLVKGSHVQKGTVINTEELMFPHQEIVYHENNVDSFRLNMTIIDDLFKRVFQHQVEAEFLIQSPTIIKPRDRQAQMDYQYIRGKVVRFENYFDQDGGMSPFTRIYLDSGESFYAYRLARIRVLSDLPAAFDRSAEIPNLETVMDYDELLDRSELKPFAEDLIKHGHRIVTVDELEDFSDVNRAIILGNSWGKALGPYFRIQKKHHLEDWNDAYKRFELPKLVRGPDGLEPNIDEFLRMAAVNRNPIVILVPFQSLSLCPKSATSREIVWLIKRKTFIKNVTFVIGAYP